MRTFIFLRTRDAALFGRSFPTNWLLPTFAAVPDGAEGRARHNDKMADVLCPVAVGRQAQLSALEAALIAALGGAGQMLFVTGEPGIGKPRLAREMVGRARTADAAVITGRVEEVFDPATITDQASYRHSTRPSAGIQQVLVNGTFVVRDGGLEADARPGRPVRASPQ